MTISDAFLFCKQFITHPRQVGAIWPSSRQLARRMVEWIDWQNVSAVMEIGPGTGAFTGFIVDNAPAHARCIALEINPQLAETLRQRFSGIETYTANVLQAPDICQSAGIGNVDAVISGLPWAVFSTSDQKEMLDAVVRVMAPQGQFGTFAYLQGLLLPAAKAFHQLLQTRFEIVERSAVAWWNLPPAIVYRCQHPVRITAS